MAGPSDDEAGCKAGDGAKGDDVGGDAPVAVVACAPGVAGAPCTPADTDRRDLATPCACEPSPHRRPHAKADAPRPAGGNGQSRHRARHLRKPRNEQGGSDAYAALDLGTNNCRLLVARPAARGFRVIDAFSRIIRLGEGLSRSGRLSDTAMERTIEALQVCADKMEYRKVRRARLIATEACRSAANGEEFLARVKTETGLELEIVNRETEARLAVSGCASLIDPRTKATLIFDIGGGSSEIAFLRHDTAQRCCPLEAQKRICAWTSLPLGVVTLAEKYGGVDVTRAVFEEMVADVSAKLAEFEAKHDIAKDFCRQNTHLLGTSGTVTTIAGVHLDLPRYDRSKVDGCWLGERQVSEVTDRLVAMSYDERIANPCIGAERADLVLAGCAILEAIRRIWPCSRLRVADRGLREGLLATMMAEDGCLRFDARPRRRRRFHLKPARAHS